MAKKKLFEVRWTTVETTRFYATSREVVEEILEIAPHAKAWAQPNPPVLEIIEASGVLVGRRPVMTEQELVEVASKFLDIDLTADEIIYHPIKAPFYMNKARVRLSNKGLHLPSVPRSYAEFWTAINNALSRR